MGAIALRDVTRVFAGGVAALDQIKLEISAGEFTAILGPSGCGKSTLLRLIAGLDRPTTGTIDSLNRESIAYVFQDAHLLPWRSAAANVALPLEISGASRSDREFAVESALKQVDLLDFSSHYPAQLSGGMRMRVSLARAIVTQPRLLLLDEPFAALDEITRQQLDEQLRELWLARKMTVVFVTHSIHEAAFLSQRAIVLSRRPGRIVLDHKIDLPANRTVAMRSEVEFASQARILFNALRDGGGL